MNEGQQIREDRYSSENLMHYHTAVAVAENLEKEGLLTARDRRKIITALTRKYGFEPGSIFAV